MIAADGGAVGNGELVKPLWLPAEQVKEKFEYVIWRSLYNAPPLEDILTSLIQFLSSQASETDISEA